MKENKTSDEIFAEALIQIIKNQIKLKEHLGLARDISCYGDCYRDWDIIEELGTIE